MEIDRLSSLTIIEDTREQTPLDFSDFPFVTVERATLHSGDYSIKGWESQFAIERKSLADLVGTITHGHERFERELGRLCSFQYAAVVVEAAEMDLRTGKYRSMLIPRSAVGMITAFEIRYRIPFHFCGNRTMAAQRIYELAYYFQREMLKEVPPPPPAERKIVKKSRNRRKKYDEPIPIDEKELDKAANAYMNRIEGKVMNEFVNEEKPKRATRRRKATSSASPSARSSSGTDSASEQ